MFIYLSCKKCLRINMPSMLELALVVESHSKGNNLAHPVLVEAQIIASLSFS